MTDAMTHPDHSRLQAFVEDSLDDADRAVVQSHVLSCARCETAIEEWRTVFNALEGLPRFAPAAGFADRVMAHVVLPQPWTARVLELLQRLVPNSTAGWALATAFLALPILATTGVMVWLTAQPGVTLQGLWMMAAGMLADGVSLGAGWLWTRLLDTTLAVWIADAVTWLDGVSGVREITLGATLFASLTLASAWILYQNLFRNGARRTRYASYSF